MTTRCHGHRIGDKSNEDQDASLRIEMGNAKYKPLYIMPLGVGLPWWERIFNREEKNESVIMGEVPANKIIM